MLKKLLHEIVAVIGVLLISVRSKSGHEPYHALHGQFPLSDQEDGSKAFAPNLEKTLWTVVT
jgi:hypothetical protein